MKSKIKNFLLRFVIFLMIFISIFLISFSLSFYFSHNFLFEPAETIKLKGAKNLLQNIDIIKSSEDNPSDTSNAEIKSAEINDYGDDDIEESNYSKIP